MNTDITNAGITVGYWVWVATSDQGSGGFDPTDVRATFCWVVRTCDGQLIKSDWNAGSSGVHDYHTGAIIAAAAAALGHVPKGKSAHIFSDVSFFTDILDADRGSRVASGYIKTNKKPLAYAEQWKALDAVVSERSLTVTAGPPPKNCIEPSAGWRINNELTAVKEAASQAARNIGLTFSDWDL